MVGGIWSALAELQERFTGVQNNERKFQNHRFLGSLFCCQVEDILAAADEDQVAMMQENVILIDEDDKVIGQASKKDCTLSIRTMLRF